MYKKWVRLSAWVSILALVATNTAFGFSAGQDPSLVGWWRLDEGTGTVVGDSSGSGYHGNLNGECTWVTGKLSGAIQMDGTNAYIQAPHIPLDSRTWTIAMWINPVLTGAAVIFREEEAASANLSLHVRIGGPSTGDQSPVRGIRLGFYGNDLETPPGLLQDNTWYHLTFWYDHENRIRRIYIDGEQIAQGTVASPFIGTSGNIAMGVWHESQYYHGIMDDVRIYHKVLTPEEIQVVMEGAGNPVMASAPSPRDKATDVPCDVVLGWTPGQYAGTHDVYFGSAFDDINNASRTNPSGLLVSQGQTDATFDPAGLLDFDQIYYWRIDEVNAPDKPGLYKGNVWSFTAETYGYPITTAIQATASSFSNALTQPSKTIDGSGLDALDQHSTSASQMWISKKSQTPVWIRYEFETVYSLHQMWVWNQNQMTELDNGYGAKDVTIEVSTDGTTWTTLAGVPEFAQAPGEETYVHNTTVDFGGVMAKFVKLNINSNWGDAKSSGLSEVRFFYVPTKAFGPTPATGATGVAVDSDLNWRAGRTAASHQVYFGTDPNALSKVGTVTDHRYSLGSTSVEYDRTYYWRVDEVNEAQTPQTWEGDVWSFSTPGYLVVDDFESYDDKCNRIFYTWVDGYGAMTPECGGSPIAGNGTGAAVGKLSAPYAERTIVHGGSQSMPLLYNNPGATSISEAVRTFTVPQDWGQGGAKTLVLYFHGAQDNTAGQLYVKINNTKVVYNGNAQALTLSLWKQWNIDLTSVSGALQSIGTLTIGVSGSGTGVVYIDDIRLYRSAPAMVQPVDPGTAGLSAYYAMEGDVKDGSGHGYNGTPMEDAVFMDGAAGHGKAMLFDGVNDYVDLPIGTLINTLSSATVAVWVNFDPSGTVGWERVFDFGTGTTNYMFLSPRQGTSGVMTFGIMTPTVAEKRWLALRTLGTSWHKVAVVIDSATKNIKLYLDGEAVASNTTTVLPKDLGVTNQSWLGRSQFTADGYYKGLMDEFTIYNRALSEGEVRYLAGDR